MKAQFVKTFIKAAAIFALATSIANCGAMPEESITESTYQPTSENTDKTTNNDDEEETTNKTPSRSTEPIVDGCEAFGLVYDEVNNTCVDDEHETNIINPPATLEDYEYLNFTVTPGERKLVATWTVDPNATSYTIEHNSVGAAYPTLSNTTGSTYTFATTFCTPKEFKLVANMTDGSTVESSILGPFAPTNCE
ncbi:MAG: hypothetical protein ACO20P_12775 [bacterium]